MSEVFMNIMAIAGLINFIMPLSVAVDSNCDYYQNVVLGQRFYIYSPGYPNKYSGGISCRWVGQSPPNTQIVVSCEVIDIPPSTNCQYDRLTVSLSGSINFQDAHNYCGKGTLSVVSSSNRIAMALYAPWYTSGGRFLCSVTAIQNAGPTTTTESPGACDCGWKQQRRIVGGIETGINEFPSMAGLISLTRRELFCGATIISTRYALTAAHCILKEIPQNVGLLCGDHNTEIGTDTGSASLYALERIQPHPYYNQTSKENDIAVVRTQNNIAFGPGVGPICLPFRFSTQDFSGSTSTALGWGTIEFSGPKSDTLQQVNLTIVSNTLCQERLTDNKIYSSQICSYAHGRDACQYDSGGPILWYDQSARRLQLLGIISYGIACAAEGFPGVNTRTTSYLAWVVSVTSDAEYCIK